MNVWATTIISGLVFVVAFMQWRTAHQKVVLDLFDRRFAVVNELNDIVSYALQNNGNLVSINAAMRLYDCESKALFLFGSNVVLSLGQIREDIHLYHRLKSELELGEMSADAGRELSDRCGAAFFKIAEHQKAFIHQVLPFMRMHTKVVPTPTEWFHERNKLRLSYADEKQR